MQVILSLDVQESLISYKNELLTNYYVSRERAMNKYKNMVGSLYGINNNPEVYPICKYKDWGQVFKQFGRLTREQVNEYWSKLSPEESKGPTRAVMVDYPMETDGVDAVDFLNKLREKYGI